MMLVEGGSMVYAVEFRELRAHLQARQEYHAKRGEELMVRAEEEEQKAGGLLGDADTVTDRMDIKASSAYSNVISHRDQLRARAREHVKRAAFFKWAGAHLPSESSGILLGKHELTNLELVND